MRKLDLGLHPVDDLFSTEESRNDEKKERVETVRLADLDDFPDHPFHVFEDDELMKVAQSIRENGIMTPAVVREKDGRYQLISGHRRKAACAILGVETMPVLIRNMTDDEAAIAVVDSNLHREHILLSEKAFAYKMKLDALSHQGKATLSQVGTKLRTDEMIGEAGGDSRNQVQRYIRLTYLVPTLLRMVDDKKIAFNPAVEISYLSHDEQIHLLDAMEYYDCTPSHAQAIKMKKLSQEGLLSDSTLDNIISEEKPNQREQIKLKRDDLRKYFPSDYSEEQMISDIFKGLELLKRQRNRNNEER